VCRLIGADRYAQDVGRAVRFLNGAGGDVAAELEQRMNDAAAQLRYEEAAELRDQLAAIGRVQHQQSVDMSGQAGDRDVDVIAVAIEGASSCVNLRSCAEAVTWVTRAFSGGWPVGARRGRPDRGVHIAALRGAAVSPALLWEPIWRRRTLPLPCRDGGQRADRRPHDAAMRGQRKHWLQMAQANAGLALARHIAEQGSQQARTQALIEALGLEIDDPDELRIECLDVSHTMGEATQASCVVFQNHQMRTRYIAGSTSKA